MKTKHISFWIVAVAAFLLLAYSERAGAEESRTVLGPRNIPMADGADALIAGNGVEGVRLTLRGLEQAQGAHERKIGHANLCAGYVMIDKPLTALEHCNWVLERYPEHWRTYNNRALAYLRLERYAESEADIARGQGLRPKSRKLKIAKSMLLDEMRTVTPNVNSDERRSALDEDSADDTEE